MKYNCCFLCLLALLLTKVSAQDTSDVSSHIFHQFKAPCFEMQNPHAYILPDSLSLKRKKQFGTMIMTCTFDTLSHLLVITPNIIFIHNYNSKSSIAAYYFKESNLYHSYGISRSDAMAYVDWALKTVPATVKNIRLPYKYKCDESKTDTTFSFIEFKID